MLRHRSNANAERWFHLIGMSHRRIELIVNGNDAAQMAIVTYTEGQRSPNVTRCVTERPPYLPS